MKQINNKAFTLIELLVVVLIIGILAAIAVPQYQKAVDKSKFAQLKLAANAIINAQKIYQMNTGYYAKNLKDLDIVFPQGQYTIFAKNDYNKIIFDWGECRTDASAEKYINCSLNFPIINYAVRYNDQKTYCEADLYSQRALDICRMEMPNAKETTYDTAGWCQYPCIVLSY